MAVKKRIVEDKEVFDYVEDNPVKEPVSEDPIGDDPDAEAKKKEEYIYLKKDDLEKLVAQIAEKQKQDHKKFDVGENEPKDLLRAILKEMVSDQYSAATTAFRSINPNQPIAFDPKDLLQRKDWVAFFAYHIHFEIDGSSVNGFNRPHPYNSKVVFEHLMSMRKQRVMQEEEITHIARYVCKSAVELKYLREDQNFGIDFHEYTADMYLHDPEVEPDRILASSIVRGWDHGNIRMRYQQEFKHVLPDHEKMRIKLIPVITKQLIAERLEKERAKQLEQERIREIKGEVTPLGSI